MQALLADSFMPDQQITTDMLVFAYSTGLFPMAAERPGAVHWYSPDPRAFLPLNQFKVSRSLRRRVSSGIFDITCDRDFEHVIRACAQPRPGHPRTWINDQIIDAYTQLHAVDLAHSIEAWNDAGQLVGGLYGVSLGGAFFGESMFSHATDASKVCLVHLVSHLNERGYTLLDVQFQSDHMARFGTIEIPRDEYMQRLQEALRQKVRW